MIGRVGWAIAALALHVDAAYAEESPAATVTRMLREKDYAFCSASTYLVGSELRWCAVADRLLLCPQFAQACAGREMPAAPQSPPANAEAAADKPLDKLAKADVDGAPDKPQVQEPNARWPTLPTFGPLFGDVLAGLLIGALLWLAWRWWRSRAAARAENPDPENPAAAVEEIELPQAPATLPAVDAALAKARQLAGRDPGMALAWLYAAAIGHLDETGAIRWQPSLGNRQLLRQLPADAAIAAPLRQTVTELEAFRFGRGQPDPAQVHSLLGKIAALIRPTAAILLAVLACACNTGDTSLLGHALAWDLLRAHGFKVARDVADLEKLDADSPAVWIDGGERRIGDGLLRQLRAAAANGAHVTVFAAPDQPLAALLGSVRAPQAADLPPPPKVVLPVEAALQWPTAATATDQPAQQAGAPASAATVVLRAPARPVAVRLPVAKGSIVIAVADLLCNIALTAPDNAAALLHLARQAGAGDQRLTVVVPAAEMSQENPSESLNNAGLWPLLGQLLLALAVLAACQGVRFGAARNPDNLQRRRFAEHIAALGQQLHRWKAPRWPAAMYCAWALERLRAKFGRGVRSGDVEGLAQRLVLAQPARNAERIAQILRDAEAVRGKTAGLEDPELLETLLALDRLLYGLERQTATRPPKQGRP